MKSLNHTAYHMKPSGIRKFFDIVLQMKDAISLGVGEPDFETPWHIREEGIAALENGYTFYTANAGLAELREEICLYQKRRFGLEYDSETECLITVGGSEGLDIMLRALLNPGDEFLVVEPCFVCYQPCTAMTGAIPVPIATKEENNFKITADEIREKITPKTKGIIISFPNNPTGAIMTKKELEEIAKVIIEHDLYVISDEIYAELTYSGKHASIAALPNMKERTIVISGFSKAYAMTGWRLGYTLAPAEITGVAKKIHQYAIMCSPTLSQYAGIEAARNGDADIARMKEAYNQRRRFLVKAFRDMGLSCFEPEGAFYIFPSIQETGLTSEEFALKLLEEQKVAVVPGNAFGDCGEGFIRCSYAYSIDELKIAVERIAKFVEQFDLKDAKKISGAEEETKAKKATAKKAASKKAATGKTASKASTTKKTGKTKK